MHNCKSRCPLYVEGTLRGEHVRKALDLTSWEAASALVRDWETAGKIGAVKIEVPRLDNAIEQFLNYVEQGLNRKPQTVRKFKLLLTVKMRPWASHRGIRELRQLGVAALRQFQETWKLGPLTTQKHTERLGHRNGGTAAWR